MIKTAPEYKKEMVQQFRSPTDINISLKLLNESEMPMLDKAFDLEYSSQSFVGNPRNLFLGGSLSENTYASFEKGRFILGKKQLIVPEDKSSLYNMGFESDLLSDENGGFDINIQKPYLKLVFKEPITLFGVILTFDGSLEQFPQTIELTEYFKDKTFNKKIFEIKNNELINAEIIQNLTALEIKWIKIKPFQYARLRGFKFVTDLIFNKNNLEQSRGSIFESDIDPIGRRLPLQTFDFSFLNENNLYNLDNPSGIYDRIKEKQQITVKYIQDIFENGKKETIQVGKFYLDAKPITEGGVVTLSSQNLISTGTDYFDYVEPNFEKISLGNLAIDVLQKGYKVSTFKIDYNALVKYSTIYIPFLQQKDILKLIAEATTCILYEDENGIINIKLISTEKQDFKLDFNTIEKNSLVTELSPQLKNLTVNIYSYEIEEDSKNLLSTVLEPNKMWQEIKLDNTIITTIASDVPIEVDESKLYYGIAVIRAKKESNISIYGKKVKTTIVNKTYKYNETGEDEIVDNPFITSNEQADAVAKWKSDYLSKRNTYSFNYRGNPELQATDLINSQTDFSENISSRVLKNKIGFNGTIKGAAILKKVD